MIAPRPPLSLIYFHHFHAACSFFCFSSVNTLHCIGLLPMATLKLPVFWSSRKLTSLRGEGASALPPLTIVHSLSALQPWRLDCTQMRHRLQRSRGCCIPAQHRRAAMTRTPRAAAAQIKLVLVRAAGGGGEGGGAPSRKYKRKLLIRTSQCVTVPVLMHAPLVHAVATALARPADADLFC